MRLWEFFNRVSYYSKKYNVDISIINTGKDMMTIGVSEKNDGNPTVLKYKEDYQWNFAREDEYDFLNRLEGELNKFIHKAISWRANLGIGV